MTDATGAGGEGGDAGAWAIDIAVAATLDVPGLGPRSREAFIEWLWETLGEDGLAGVCEGTVAVEEAAAAGLIASPLVLDAAESPSDRDWVAGMPRAALTCWFGEEAAARRAADAVGGVRGCEVRGIRREQTSDAAAAAWREAFDPVEVPGFGVVRPAWEPGSAAVTAGRATIFIEPGLGFGTGLHETTQLCLAAIAGWCDAGGRMARILDFGSGSGILGIAAAVLGAAHVDAVEIDGRVHDAIRSNAARNGVAERLCVSAAIPAGSCYDLVVASVVAPVLVAQSGTLSAVVRRDDAGRVAGGLVLCGILADEVPSVAAAYAARLGVEPTRSSAGGWHCLRFAVAGQP